MASTIPTVQFADQIFNGTVTFGQAPQFPAGSIGNDEIEASAAIEASKLSCHRTAFDQAAAINVEPASGQYVPIHMSQAAGGLTGFSAAITGVLPATTGVVSVDLFRSTAGATFVSVLSAPVRLGSDNTLLVPELATIATSTMAASDVYAYRMTVSTTTVARGVAIAMKYYEKFA
jgi:hypothetical protein